MDYAIAYAAYDLQMLIVYLFLLVAFIPDVDQPDAGDIELKEKG